MAVNPAPQSEQRREKRYKVDLWGELRFEDGALPVRIGDLSASGALIYLDFRLPPGSIVTLHIEQFGEADVQVMHAKDNFCGVAFVNPGPLRPKLMKFLAEEVAVGADGAAEHANP